MTPVGAACAVHPDRDAVATCTRCGSFACVECARPTGVCVACDDRGHEPVAWEDPNVPALLGFFRTLGAILFRPRRFFGGLPDGRWGAAFRFSWIVATLSMVPFMVAYALRSQLDTPHREAGYATGYLVGSVIGSLCAPPLWGGLFVLIASGWGVIMHAIAKATGGRATMEESVRASAYAATWLWAALVVTALVWYTLPRAVAPIAAVPEVVLGPVGAGQATAWFLLERHRTRPVVAWLTALAPGAILLALLCGICGLGFAIGLGRAAP